MGILAGGVLAVGRAYPHGTDQAQVVVIVVESCGFGMIGGTVGGLAVGNGQGGYQLGLAAQDLIRLRDLAVGHIARRVGGLETAGAGGGDQYAVVVIFIGDRELLVLGGAVGVLLGGSRDGLGQFRLAVDDDVFLLDLARAQVARTVVRVRRAFSIGPVKLAALVVMIRDGHVLVLG